MAITWQIQLQILITIASVAALFACSREANESPQNRSTDIELETALADISQADIQSHLACLAADGRAGTRIDYSIAMEDQCPAWNDGDFFGEKFGQRP